MQNQLDLFESPRATSAASSKRQSRESRNAANKRAEPWKCAQAQQVLQIIQQAGKRGITRQEIADQHGLRVQSVCGRVNALLKQEPQQVFVLGNRNGQTVLFAKGYC